MRADRLYMPSVSTNRLILCMLMPAAAVLLLACTETFLNQTASLGGSVAGNRGSVRVLFINNTTDRAVLTFGTYDQADLDSQPDFGQFALDELDARADVLESGDSSPVFTLDCGRVFAVGSGRLLDAMDRNLSDDGRIAAAEQLGARFFTVPEDDDSDIEPAPSGAAAPMEKLLGVDFACASLLIVRLEINDVGDDPFRIDFEVIPSESTR